MSTRGAWSPTSGILSWAGGMTFTWVPAATSWPPTFETESTSYLPGFARGTLVS